MDEYANKKFGPPYAVFNLSKIGLRYFRICINVSPASKEKLIAHFVNHPNVGWIFSAEGWFNLAIGIWAKDNAEINDISEQIRSVLSAEDEIVLQSELTSLYSFGDRKMNGNGNPMCMIDATTHSIDLLPIEIDYIKLLALDSSLEEKEMQTILNVNKGNLNELKNKLTNAGVIVGYQDRVNYSGTYFKVFIDSSSKKRADAVNNLIENIWQDTNCIYFNKANNKYDIEFELILEDKSLIDEYVKDFSDFKTAVLTENIYTNIYPVNKIANLKEIRETFSHQDGNVIDFRNSKLWYLNYDAVKSYLDVYNGNKKYFETMEKGEIDIFGDVVEYLKKNYKNTLFSIADIGSGDGLKGRLFIEKLGEQKVKAYYPIDIQPIELAAALHAHSNGSYAKHPTLLNIENLSARFPLRVVPEERQLSMFFGGTYGNFKSEEINLYLRPMVSDTSTLFIAMPIIVNGKTDQEIINSYFSPQMEDIAFGPLLQAGFKKTYFRENKKRAGYILNIGMESSCLVCSFILNKRIEIFGKIFDADTIFKMTTSWKPTLDEFRSALEKDFILEKIFHNNDIAIAMINRKKY